MAVLGRIAAQSGVPPMRLMREIASLSFGPGKIAFADYVRLRLFDDDFWVGVDKRTVIGRRRNREIVAQANRPDAGGVCANKVAAGAYLSAFGFAVPRRAAIYAPDLAAPGMMLLRARDQLREFLLTADAYPLLGRPAWAAHGLGAAELLGVDAAAGVLSHADGRRQPVEAFIDHLCDNFTAGYLFDHRPAPHPSLTGVAGDRLTTVSLVTAVTDQGPRLFRACWTLPTRNGELILRLDPRTGAVLDCVSDDGLEMRRLAAHPETEAPFAGVRMPDWQALRASAVEAARLFPELGLVGWRIAPSADGAVIVDVDEQPDLLRHQLAERRGVVTPEFQAFLGERRETLALSAAAVLDSW